MPRERAEILAALTDPAKGFAPPQGKRDHDFFFFQHPDKIAPVFTEDLLALMNPNTLVGQ